MASITVNFSKVIKPYVKKKVDREIADYRYKAQERLNMLFDSLVDDFTEEIVRAIAVKVDKKVKK
jgi:hypothetical protein